MVPSVGGPLLESGATISITLLSRQKYCRMRVLEVDRERANQVIIPGTDMEQGQRTSLQIEATLAGRITSGDASEPQNGCVVTVRSF